MGRPASAYPIRELAPHQAAEFDAIFRRSRDMPVSLSGWAAQVVGRRSWRCFGAFDGDRVIATGAVFIGGDFAWLGFGSTLAPFREQGLQSTLIKVRIDAARGAGVSLITAGARECQAAGRPILRSPTFVGPALRLPTSSVHFCCATIRVRAARQSG